MPGHILFFGSAALAGAGFYVVVMSLCSFFIVGEAPLDWFRWLVGWPERGR